MFSVPTTQNGTKLDVVIIGAGMSGVAAARKLKDKKLNYVILESTDRVGGRIFSKTLPDIG